MRNRLCVALLLLLIAASASAEMQATVGIAVQVYSPAENVAEAVYGTAIAPTVFYEVRERSYLALRFGAGFIRQSGDAYAGSRYLTNGPRSYQTLVPVELALCGRVPMATGDRPAAMTLVLGGGIQRTFFREKYPESPVTRGSGFTTLFFAGPEFAVGRSASLSIEYRVTSGVILVRSDDESFDVDLEAGAVQIAFRQNF